MQVKKNSITRPLLASLILLTAACGPGTKPQPTEALAPTSTRQPIATSTATLALTTTITPTPTPTPQDVPPVIVVKESVEVNVGEKVILDASSTFDFDGNSISFTWSQVHNPDRYTGIEYVTGHDVEIETTTGMVTAFTPEWPGIYRFVVTASDKNGETTENIEVLVRPGSIMPIRGIGFAWWFGSQSDRDIVSVLNQLKSMGINWIQFVPYWCQESLAATDVHPCTPKDELEPISTSQLRKAIQEAHDRGLMVLLKPHIYVSDWQPMYQIIPSNWDTWFVNYTNYLVQMAKLADEENVEMLSVGNELAQSHANHERWFALIQEARSVFSGSLTYSDLCIQRPGLCHQGFPAWDYLDYIGVSFYYNGTCSPMWGCEIGQRIPASTNPPVDLMTLEIDRQLSLTLDQIQSKYSLPVIATEIGIQNVDGANYEPAGSPSLEIDNQEQADWYEAALQATSIRPFWQGHFWCSVDPLLKPFSFEIEVPDKTFDPRFKPAEEVLAVWYGGR